MIKQQSNEKENLKAPSSTVATDSIKNEKSQSAHRSSISLEKRKTSSPTLITEYTTKRKSESAHKSISLERKKTLSFISIGDSIKKKSPSSHKSGISLERRKTSSPTLIIEYTTKRRSESAHKSISLERKKSKNKKLYSIKDAKDQEIPTRGSLLLEWVKKRMSYEDGEKESSEEDEIPIENIEKERKKSDESRTSIKDKKTEEKKEEEKKKDERKKGGTKKVKVRKTGSGNIVVRLPRPDGMTDDVIETIKEKRRIAEELARVSTSERLTFRPKIRQSSKQEQEAIADEIQAQPRRMTIESDIERRIEEAKMDEANKESNISTTKINIIEQSKRLEGLKVSLDCIKSFEEHNRKLESREMRENYWKLYVKCGPLPIVNHIPDMTSYLQIWQETLADTTTEEASNRTKDALKLLSVLYDFIENKPPKSQKRRENYIWLKGLLRAQLREMMEALTFKILRNIDKNLEHLTLSTGQFNYVDENFTIYLWLKFQWPKPLFNPRKPLPPPIKLSFENLKLDMDLPQTISGESMVMRAMYLIYDHLSDSSRSFEKPPIPEYYSFNLADVIEKEWRVKQKYKVIGRYRANYEQDLQRLENNIMSKTNDEDDKSLELPALPNFELPEVDIDGVIPEVKPMRLDPTPEEYAGTLEEMDFKSMRSNLCYSPVEFEINLRKYIILGGLFVTNLFYQPPQPLHLVSIDLSIVRFILPKRLEEVPFYESYSTLPPSDEQKSPEELESAIRLQEEGFAKLISITLSFPTHVMYLEPPVVCMWEEENKFWSTRDIHDVKQNEEKGMVSFRAGRFGIFGLATFRYGNLPYQTWEIKPDQDGNITFQLNAAIIMFEFKINGKLITVTQFQNGPNNAMQDIVSKSFSLNELAKIFREGGVDIFPDHDAFCYIEGSCEKHWPTEYICYYNMAQLSICYNFAWSRWNATEGFRSIIMQMRIYNTEMTTQKQQSLVLVTPLRAAFINCTEVAPIFCDEPVEGSKFSCTLWHLMKSTSTIYVRNKINDISQETVYTVAQLLIGTRILSFS